MKQAEGSEYEQVDVAIALAGVIRGSFDKGEITVGDAFNALSLGTGKDLSLIHIFCSLHSGYFPGLCGDLCCRLRGDRKGVL